VRSRNTAIPIFELKLTKGITKEPCQRLAISAFCSCNKLIQVYYFSGYKLEDIGNLAHRLNAMLHKEPKTALTTVRNKYSHK
jgi:hypothetical protein